MKTILAAKVSLIIFGLGLLLMHSLTVARASIGPFGGGVSSIAIDPYEPSTVYVGTGVGVFKSTDGGESWSEVNNFR